MSDPTPHPPDPAVPPRPDSAAPADTAQLLGLGDRLKDFLNCLDLTADPESDAPSATPSPHFARYRILRLIGEGGMGSVYEAEQHTPRRRVALKLIKPGMDTRQVIARFAAEREALALMDHPHIAKVFDAGATDAGRPYFAMELVDGVPITSYCDAHAPTVRQRLELFVLVCRAVQHAHQKGIIHRDLKPSNVLVTTVDGQPQPKVIDFGIAKAVTGHRPTGQHTLTKSHQLVGTPEYMSPEQAGAAGGDVDTRSDVYSLGVLLYELLTGTTPFAHKQLGSLAHEEVRRVIRDVEPPRPSTRLKSGPRGVPGERDRSPAPQKEGSAALLRAVRGDLDWIVTKCLEKDRDRRYGTASELAGDLERHLRDEPVHAGPPTTSYRLRKFARRHRAPLAAAAAMAALLVTGIAGTTLGLVRAREARFASQREAEKARATVDYLQSIFLYVDPDEGGGGADVRVVDLLRRAAAEMPDKLKGQPEVEMHARYALVRVFWSLGLEDEHGQNLQRAYDLVGETASHRTPLGLEITRSVAEFQRDRPDRVAIARAAAADAESVLGHHSTTVWAKTTLAQALVETGNEREAETILRSVCEECRRRPVADVNPFLRLGMLYGKEARLAEAEQVLREADAYAAQHRPRARHRLRVCWRLARVLVRRDKAQEAAAVFDAAWVQFAGSLPVGDPEMAQMVDELVVVFHNQGTAEHAAPLYKHYWAALTSLVERPATTLPALERRARAYCKLGRWEAAAEDYARCIDLDPSRHDSWGAQACVLANAGDRTEYDAHCRRMLEHFGATTDRTVAEQTARTCLLMPPPPEQVDTLVKLADCAVDGDKPHPSLPWFRLAKGMAEYRAGNYDTAIQWLDTARTELVPEGKAGADVFLAMAHQRAGRLDEARAALERARRAIDRTTLPAGLAPVSIGVPTAHLLQREAELLIFGASLAPPTTRPN